MDNYQGDLKQSEFTEETYLINYQKSDNKLVEHYSKLGSINVVPYTEHNIEACNRRLLKQHNTVKKEALPKLKKDRMFYMGYTVFWTMFCGICIRDHSYVFLLYALGQGFFDCKRLVNIDRKIKRFKLTDFCLEHALEIQSIQQDLKNANLLSKRGQWYLESDGIFSLNHSHEYKIKDLKQLKKSLRGK